MLMTDLSMCGALWQRTPIVMLLYPLPAFFLPFVAEVDRLSFHVNVWFARHDLQLLSLSSFMDMYLDR